MAIYFITEAWLEKNTPITANVNAAEVTPWVQTNAENWVRKIIGTYFFNDLLTKYNAQTLSANEQIIVGLMQPAIAWRAASDASFGLSYQLKNKGVQTQSGDYSAAAELREVQFNMEFYNQKASIYEAAIYEYLAIKANKDLFANYTSALNTDSRAKDCENPGYNKSIMVI